MRKRVGWLITFILVMYLSCFSLLGLFFANSKSGIQPYRTAGNTETWHQTAVVAEGPGAPNLVYTMHINGTVTAGTASHIKRSIKAAEQNGAKAAVIILNTPGGLVTATLDIVEAIMAAQVPVITFVNPQAAIAASAGTFILLSGNLAAMSPGTTCGAAMPVQMSTTGENEAADQKTINFMAEHMKSIAALRDRPQELAERFVKENLSLSHQDALALKVVDFEAENLEELLAKINGEVVQTGGGQQVVQVSEAGVKNIEMNTSERLIHVISNPMLAMLLVMIGIYGVITAVTVPGLFLPEILAAISLILGLYGMGLFEVNITAGLLIALGIGLLIAEAFTPAFGILGVGGLISTVLGILFFPLEPLLPAAWWASFRIMALGIGVVGLGFLALVVGGIWRLRRLEPRHGKAEFSGRVGVVIRSLKPQGLIRVQGEIWQARAEDEQEIEVGSRVEVLEKAGLVLLVKPVVDPAD